MVPNATAAEVHLRGSGARRSAGGIFNPSDSHGVTWDRKEPLHSRAAKYVKALDASYPLRDASRAIIKCAIGVFEKFNYVRNDNSLAHDNDLPDHAEARFIFDSIATILRFIKSIEATRFGS